MRHHWIDRPGKGHSRCHNCQACKRTFSRPGGTRTAYTMPGQPAPRHVQDWKAWPRTRAPACTPPAEVAE